MKGSTFWLGAFLVFLCLGILEATIWQDPPAALMASTCMIVSAAVFSVFSKLETRERPVEGGG